MVRKTRSKTRVSSKAPPLGATAARLEAQRLGQELQIHQVELEMQNVELHDARARSDAVLARYTELFDFAPIGYATIDEHDRIRQINHCGARLFGKPRAHLVGIGFNTAVSAADAATLASLLGRVRDAGESQACDVAMQWSDEAGPRVFHITGTPQPREPGTLLLAFEDITERVREQERLAETERALRETARRKDEFLAILSHELRNPLTPLRTSVFTLRHAEPGSDAAEQARAIIDRQVAHLAQIVDDLLDVTRMTTGKLRLQLERVDLLELLRGAVEDHRAACEERGITLAVACVRGPLWADADPVRVVQATTNVLGNGAQVHTVRRSDRGQRAAAR